MSVVFALSTGASFTHGAVSIQYCVTQGFDLAQASYDAYTMLHFFTFILYWYEYLVNDFEYTLEDTALASLQMFLITVGIISISYAISYGKAAPIQAIENSKVVVQTLLGIIFLDRIPNWIQTIGLVIGITGVLIIIL